MEAQLKILFLLSFLGLLGAVSGVARELKRRSSTQINQMAHEIPILRIVRPALGIVFYCALLDWLLPGTRLEWAFSPLAWSLRWTGGAALFSSVMILWWSFRTMGRNYRGGVGLWDDHELVVSGPYHWVRHPIYAAFVLAMIGAWGLSANWLVGVAGVALTLSIPAFRLPTEERQLAERFGATYAQYSESTRRFVPGVF